MPKKKGIKLPIFLDHSSFKYPFPENLLNELSQELQNMNTYPSGGRYRDLSFKLAEYTGVTSEHILPTNGSDEVIEAVTRAFGNQLILIPVPTFSQYEVSADRNKFAKKLVTCLSSDDYQLNYSDGDLKKASLVWICNPNNPTGNSIPRREIEKILTNSSGIVAVDECNFEYLGESVIDLIEQYPNLVISRSFSKNFGLAGFRLGFAVSSPLNIKKIANYCQHFRVNKMAEIAGMSALKYLDYYKHKWQEIGQTRNQFIDGLRQMKLKVFFSHTNFVLVDFITKEKTNRVWSYLKREGVHTFPAWGEEFSGLDNHYIRFTIGNQKEMSFVLMLLKDFQKSVSA